MLCKNIKELRLSKDYTQSDAAKIFGISAPAYSAYESGKSIPPLDKLIHISEHYSVSLDWLCGLSDGNFITPSVGDIALFIHHLVSSELFSLSSEIRSIKTFNYTVMKLTTEKKAPNSLIQFLQAYLDMNRVLVNKQISEDVFNEWLIPRIKELSESSIS